MSLYLTAFSGRHGGGEISGFLWTPEPGQPVRQVLETLRQEDPWNGARQAGKEIFTLGHPDNPEGDHLTGGREGAWKPDFTNQGTRGLALLLLLRILKQKKLFVDVRTGFVTIEHRELPDGKMEVHGLELHLEGKSKDQFLLWAHPVRRLMDARPTALSEHGHRALDVWFPLEGVSVASAHPKKGVNGTTLQIGRRAKFVRPGDPVAVVLSEQPGDLSAQQVIQALRGWFANGTLDPIGLSIAPDPQEANTLGLSEFHLDLPDFHGLDWEGRRVHMDDIFQKAQRGDMSVRVPRLPPATFHLTGLRPDLATATAHALNQRASHWNGVALQFAAEALPGSLELPMDPKSPMVIQPQSPKASGQASALFLECVRIAGGDPWRLNLEGMPYALGIAHAFLYGKMHHLALALLDPTGRLVGSAVLPFRFTDLAETGFIRNLASRLWKVEPSALVVHVDESLDLPHSFLEHLAPSATAWKMRRRSAPRAFSGRTFAWMPVETGVASADLAMVTVSGAHGEEHVSLERLSGTAPVDAVLSHALALEYAWVPGRSERRRLPATLEWARGLLYQKDRFGAFAPGRFEG
ncbi:MAG TPA: hypothetical protein PKO15_03470 [Fibrobacteria bacterium]|nr:hypothetical protein [Fibrobacteria bacterium]